MEAPTRTEWMAALRAVAVAIVAIATVAIASPQAEAKKKEVDLRALATTYLVEVESLVAGVDPWVETLLQDMNDDIDAAVEKGRLKNVLSLQKRYAKLIDKRQKKDESSLVKKGKKVSKAIERADPENGDVKGVAISVRMATMDANLKISTSADYLREQLADLIDQAIADLTP